jgi:hypothetical protein
MESLMQSYEGSELRQFRKLTINQIQLLRHASSVNHERSDEYCEWKKQFDDKDGQPAKPKTKVKVKMAGDVTEMPSAVAIGMMFGR